jgi:uncharacterized membrane protein (UPF0127 family)
VTFEVEVANEDRTRQRGLMFRRQMAENAGMLFLFEEQEHLSFWMHNTYLPLDMVFITSAMRVLGAVRSRAERGHRPASRHRSRSARSLRRCPARGRAAGRESQ